MSLAGGLHLRSHEALAVGVSSFVAVAGLALAVDGSGPAFFDVAVIFGAAVVTLELGRRAWSADLAFESLRPLAVAGAAGLVAAIVLLALWRTAYFVWNACDDDVAYLYLAERLVIEGDLLDSLNNRRLTSLGGMSELQALFLTHLSNRFLPAPDAILGSLLILVSLWRTGSGRWSGWGMATAVVMIVSLFSLQPTNTSPIVLPVGLALAALLFVARLRASVTARRPELAGTVVLGLLVGSAFALRPQFGLPLLGFAAGVLVWPVGTRMLGRLAGLGVGVIVAVSGYAVASWRAVGTPVFPLWSGYLDPTWPANGPEGEGPTLTELLETVAETTGASACAAGVVIGILTAALARRDGGVELASVRWGVRALVLLAAVSIGWLIALTVYWWSVAESAAYWRFWAPLVWAVVLAPVAVIDSVGWRSLWVGRALHVLALGLVLSTLAWSPAPYGRSPLRAIGDIVSEPVQDLADDRYASARDEYERAAATIPTGSKVIAAVDAPSLLLGQGLVVHSIDLVGSTSPPPHLPYFQGSARKLAWLRENGYDYVIATAPSASICLYNRARQEANLEGGGLYGAWAPYNLDWFGFLDEARERPTKKFTAVGPLLILEV